MDLLGRGLAQAGHPRSVKDTVLRDLRGGGTILLHDSDCTSATGSWRTTLRALPRILDACQARDWQIGALVSCVWVPDQP